MEHLYQARILLVDDNTDILDMLKNILTRRGFLSIQTASNCEMARALFKKHQPELIILDIMSPPKTRTMTASLVWGLAQMTI